MKKDQTKWVEIINKLTGLDAAVAKEALVNAFPDYRIHKASTLAIAEMMRDLKYISTDVSGPTQKNIDYSFLMTATGKPKNELGE